MSVNSILYLSSFSTNLTYCFYIIYFDLMMGRFAESFVIVLAKIELKYNKDDNLTYPNRSYCENTKKHPLMRDVITKGTNSNTPKL